MKAHAAARTCPKCRRGYALKRSIIETCMETASFRERRKCSASPEHLRMNPQAGILSE